MMRVAVQLYGHLRTFRDCAPALKKHLLDHYEADVFIHTWDQTEHTTKSWYKDGIKCQAETVGDDLKASIKKLYSPKAIKVEKQNLFEDEGYYGTHDKVQISLQGMRCMVYSQYSVNNLRRNYEKKHGIVYDYVLVIRPDVMPFVKVDFEKYKPEFEFFKNTSIHFVHYGELNERSGKLLNYPLIAECFYFSKPDVINKITSVYQDFDYYYKDIIKIFPKQVENPEISFFESVLQKGIMPRQYVNYFAIKRHNDKDDIKLVPPEQVVSLEKKAEGSRIGIKIVKYLLESFSNNLPRFIILKLITILNGIGTCGLYLRSLQNKR